MLGKVLKGCIRALQALLTFAAVGAVLFGSVMFAAEAGTYDDTTGTFRRVSISGDSEVTPFGTLLDSFWYIFVTATTVGYGDVYV
jgi:potassium voltage-gated channel Shal-related subfamily D protein 2